MTTKNNPAPAFEIVGRTVDTRKSAIVELKNITKTYGIGDSELKALDDVNLFVKPGEFISVMGPSGCGKSTLMNLIGCLDRPTSGKVFINGKDASTLTDNQLAGLRSNTIGFVFQTFNLVPRISALKNVAMPLVFAGVPRGERERRARKILESVGLGKRLSHTPDKLSGGERQRIAIARALVNDPKMILADEPTGNLDSNTGKEIMETIKGLNRQGKTILLVTHDQKVADYAGATYHMKDGRIESIEISRVGV